MDHIAQALDGRLFAAEQAVQLLRQRKFHIARKHHFRHIAGHADRTHLAQAPQFAVEHRLVQLDQLRLAQQGADLAAGTFKVDAGGARQHLHFLGGAHMRQHPCADIDALADVYRLALGIAENVYARQRRQGVDAFSGDVGGIAEVQ
jgi:hypothetical protein